MRRAILTTLVLSGLLLGPAARGQSLNEQLDQDRFLRGLAEYGLHDLLDYVLESSGANDAALPALVEIAHLQARLGETLLSTEGRSQTIDRLIAARRALLRAFPNDPRVPLWQADLAFSLLFLDPARTALDLTVEFGIADAAQRERMAAIADEAMDLVDDAIVRLSDEILDLEEDEDFGSSAAMQQRHRYLLQVEQRQRLPFLNAAAVYYTTLGETGERANESAGQVIGALMPLLGELSEPWLSRARSMLGVSLVRVGRFDDARKQFDTVLASASADGIAVLRARLGGIQMLRASEGRAAGAAAIQKLASVPDVRRDPFTSLLLCDQQFIEATGDLVEVVDGRRAYRSATGEAAQRIVQEAVRVYRAYLENALLPLNESQREEVVAARWRLILPESIPLPDLPPEMALAQAERMTTDRQRQAEAMTLLEALLERHSGDSRIAPRLLLALANVHASRDEIARAAELWIDVATRFPLSPRAERAAEQAAAVLSAAVLDQPADAQLSVLYEQALTLMVERFPQADSFDRWAYERGLLHARAGRYEQAAHSYALVSSESPLHVDAAFQLVQVKWSHASAQTVESQRLGLLRETAEAADRAGRLVDQALTSATGDARRLGDLRYYRVAAAVRAAQADRERAEYEAALKRLDGLERREGVDDALAAEIIDTRISILEVLQRTEQIESDLKELARHSPERALGIITRIAAQRLADADRLLATGDEEGAAAMARERIEPVSRLGWEIAQPLNQSGDGGLAAALCQADALRIARDYERALGVYEQVLVWREHSAEATLGRAECLFQLERFAAALPGFQRLAAARAETRDATFWLAELRILQIFDQADRNTDRIYARIQRLRLLDSQFGGSRYRKDFAVLEDRYAP